VSDVRARNLEQWVVEALRDEDRYAGYRNLESYLRHHFRDEAVRRRRAFADDLESWQAECRQRHGLVSDSAELIRQDREERG
jgi:hypothetical protein